MNTQQLLDRVFNDPRTKHYLDLFTLQEKKRLQMFERKGKVRIRCLVRDRDFAAKPEEVVRQLALIHLHYTLGYPIDRLAVEVSVHMGSGVHEKAADVVVYRGPQKLIPYIILEVKKPRRRDGREQLHSYVNATGAPYGWWTNGRETSYEIRTEPNLFGDLPRLPNVNETEEDVRQPIRKHEELQVWPDDKRTTAEFSNNTLARSRLEPGDLLITIKGKVGVAAVVPEFEGEWNINQDIARAQMDPTVNPYYLAVFFESELGQAQVDRMTTGAINPFLGLGNLVDFPVPIPPRDVQDRFERITRGIIERRRQSQALLEQAKRKVEALIESEVACG